MQELTTYATPCPVDQVAMCRASMTNRFFFWKNLCLMED